MLGNAEGCEPPYSRRSDKEPKTEHVRFVMAPLDRNRLMIMLRRRSLAELLCSCLGIVLRAPRRSRYGGGVGSQGANGSLNSSGFSNRLNLRAASAMIMFNFRRANVWCVG